MVNYADECMNNYPPDHVPAMVVPKGGSSCAKCIFLTKDRKHCNNQYYIRWRLSKGEVDASLIPSPVNRYCSDWFRPRNNNPISHQVMDKLKSRLRQKIKEGRKRKRALEAATDFDIYWTTYPVPYPKVGRLYQDGLSWYFKGTDKEWKGKTEIFDNKRKAKKFLKHWGMYRVIRSKNPFWRTVTGYHHEKGVTAGDVVRYEQQELGNDYGITEKQLKELDRYPAWCLVWVTKKKKDAKRYGRPQLFDVGKDYKVIAEDGDGGYLILMLGNGKKSNPVSAFWLKGQDEPKVKTGDYVRIFEPHTGKWLDGFVRSSPEEKKGIWWIKVRIGDREVTAVWNGDDFILGRV